MIGDLNTGNLSEIPWKSTPGSEEKFYFENEMVFFSFLNQLFVQHNLIFFDCLGLYDIFWWRVDTC